MIEKLNWDSDFFGYPVGAVQLKNLDKKYLNELVNHAVSFKLVYIFLDEKIDPEIEVLQLVDIKTRLRKVISKEPTFPVKSVADYAGEDDEQLRRLALQSGIYSRFKTDLHFINKEFEKLYLKWMEDSINKKIADKVIVCKEDGKCVGFVSLKFKQNFSEIGLIAVDEENRGKGVGRKLLAHADHCSLNRGLSNIEVVTQFDNHPAMKLYEKLGYKFISKKYVYHLWN